ncbi:uncharacterized protein Fot_00745 [Forsythia ovata]|uniref:DUF7769 domain-containing protein n=1 Tax=Forsythia ovata TaxID=205694 RepID=A0ABD1X215_9LAMI
MKKRSGKKARTKSMKKKYSVPVLEQNKDVNSIGNNVAAPKNMRGPNKKKNFTSETRRVVFEMLLGESRDGKIPKGALSKVANSFSISRISVSRIWHDAKCSSSTICDILDFSSKLVKRVGRKESN